MNINAYSIAEAIDLNRLAQAIGKNPAAQNGREMFYPEGKNGFWSAYSFGAVVFCNIDPATELRLRELARLSAQNLHEAVLTEDHVLKKGKLAFSNSELTVPKIDAGVLRVVMQSLAYSVTLDHYRRIAVNLLATVKTHAAELEHRGKIRLREKNLNRFIGRVLNVKNRIAEHFYIFSNLEETWENDLLTRVQRGMAQSLDLHTRFEEVGGSFRIIEENLHMFNEFHMHGQSYRIEIIITLLIVIEVLDLIGDKFKVFH